MKKFILLAAVAPAFGYAQETPPEQTTMVVTANRIQQSATSVIAPLTVISRGEIESSGAQDIVGILNQQVGISVNRNGGKGQNESVFIRGSSSAQSLYLIDGVRINTATSGGAQMSLLPLEFVERIEIIRGARASVYGADAVGGVINIITRPEFGSQYFGIKAALGNHESRRLAGRVNTPIGESTQLNAILNGERSEGYNFRPSSELDEVYGYESFGGLLSIEHQFSEAWSGGAMILMNDGENEYISTQYDSSYNPYDEKWQTKQRQKVYAVNLDYSDDAWFSHLALNYTENRSNDGPADQYAVVYRYVTERHSANWLLARQLNNNWLLQGGLDYQKDDISGSKTTYLKSTRNNKAAYLGVRADYIRHLLEASLRQDNNQHYGEHTTYNLAWAWQLQDNLRFNALHGTAFRAPTFNDLYYPGSETPNLKAETSSNSEFGFALDLIQSQWQFNIFRNDVDDLIAWAPGEGGLWKPGNVSDARIQGIEVQGDFSTAWLNHRVILEHLDAKDRQSDKYLVRRPQEQVKYKLDAQWHALQVVVDYLWRGESYNDDANTLVLDSYSTWDIGANYRFANGFKLDAKLANVFNKQYATVRNYQAQGRSFELAASYQF
ncbi:MULTISPECIES: TonB-dependent receptor domain-containing protein [unclassified Agarivorans]|uniref:TonB-dependent receptor domain-containing protein n=1 Tax=unclassified Agarivorans TaxID=2636026 RepID=UPI003D7E2F2E